ncbi:MAG: prepilin-type N-terminal cleavage/methylation domain-containing protein [Planctomycetes bacterium]|nr:prepilin-type N-terminal cleavage/methylation domain-containing protein [Planctomycetota bacterium]
MTTRGRAGFTLIEAMIAIALVAVVLVKVGMLAKMRSDTSAHENTELVIDDQARRVLEQISYAVMGASRERLIPDPESPIYSSELRFEVSLGLQDGKVVWGDAQWVGLDKGDNQVAWRERPDAPDERHVVWCKVVRPFLEGELMNGVDDNGNGLIDEKGLVFTLEGSKVTVRLTLERKSESGEIITHTVETMVTCRN